MRRPAAFISTSAAANTDVPGRFAVNLRRLSSPAVLVYLGDGVDRVLCLSGRCTGPVRREDVQLRGPLRGVGGRPGGSLSVLGVVR